MARRRVALALALAACGEADPPAVAGAPALAATAEAWALLAPDDADDPFAAHRADRHPCAAWAVTVEGQSFEIATDACDYATAAQPLRVDVPPGGTMGATVAHFPATAPEGVAEAHLVIQLGGAEAWHQVVPLPATQQIYEPRWTLPQGAAAGTPVYFHVRNHGSNAWFIADVTRDPAPPRGD